MKTEHLMFIVAAAAAATTIVSKYIECIRICIESKILTKEDKRKLKEFVLLNHSRIFVIQDTKNSQ
jgi:hypothetical protein